MSQAEALLQSMTEDVHTHEHVVTDHDSYFVIDPDSRVIENASQTENTVMQYDHNSEKFTFELPRHVEGHDMTLCNRVRVHFNNVDGETNEENVDVAELYDLAVCPDDSDKVRCSWSITRQATQLAGTLNFLVQFECIDDVGASVYEWHTDIYTDVVVKKGRNNAEQAVIEYSNVLEQWYQRIFGAGDSVIAAVAAEGDRQKEAIARKAEETLATIPEDYTTTHNMAEEALRRKANAIELDAEGESIVVNDSSDAYLLGLKLYGKTTQKTAPNPDNPQELKSVENPTIDLCGKNLLNPKMANFPSGVTERNEDLFTTTFATGGIHVRFDQYMKPGRYTFSLFPDTEVACGIYIYSKNSTQLRVRYIDLTSSPAKFEFETNEEFYIALGGYSKYTTFKYRAMLEAGWGMSPSYEPYKSVQNITLYHTLNGVTNAFGNTVYDEIDLERGVRIQRLGDEVIDGSETLGVGTHDNGQMYTLVKRQCVANSSVMSDRYIGSNWCERDKHAYILVDNLVINDSRFVDVETTKAILANEKPRFVYALATPIETPLTEEEIAYYKKLKTHYHNTTVINDHNAHMAIKYAADTEIFLRDNQPKPTDEQIQAAVNEYASQNGVQVPTDDHIAAVIAKYLRENTIDTGSKLTIGTVELSADKWVERSENLHSQVVTIDGVTPYSQVDLTPGVEQLVVFYEKDLTFVTENEDGIVTVYAIGQKPTNDYAIQVTIKEVSV